MRRTGCASSTSTGICRASNAARSQRRAEPAVIGPHLRRWRGAGADTDRGYRGGLTIRRLVGTHQQPAELRERGAAGEACLPRDNVSQSNRAGMKTMWMNGAAVKCKLSAMHKKGETEAGPPDIPGFPRDWREQIKAHLADQLASGGTLYGIRSDGAYIARTSDGDRVLSLPDRDCV